MSSYHNPPRDIPKFGRSLRNGTFDFLMRQLKSGEVLMAFYHDQVPAPVATHVDSAERQQQIEEAWKPVNYYGFPLQRVAKEPACQ